MGVMKRFTGIVQAKTNKLLDKAEDPRESLDLSYQKQLVGLGLDNPSKTLHHAHTVGSFLDRRE